MGISGSGINLRFYRNCFDHWSSWSLDDRHYFRYSRSSLRSYKNKGKAKKVWYFDRA